MRAVESNNKVTRQDIAGLREGDHLAYEYIYLHYVSSVRRFLILLTRSEETAEEITQEVFITLWEKRANLDPDNNIPAYLYTIARNLAYKYFNRQKAFASLTDTLAENNNVFNVSPDEILIAREREILVEIAVSRMPAQRKRIYEMSRVEGLSNNEIAELLGISKNTVENHITTALKDLREVLASALMMFW